MWVFGGYNLDVNGGALDTLETFKLQTNKLDNFLIRDSMFDYWNTKENDWKFRLPWPLFDMTSVKIPVRFLNFFAF